MKKNTQPPSMPSNSGDVPWMKNLSSCTNRMKEEGYREDFQVIEDGVMTTFDHSKRYKPEHVTIVSFYRFEGPSDPGDNTILYVIETNDGTKGTLTDGYGAYADEHVAAFIVDVERIQKAKVSDLHA